MRFNVKGDSIQNNKSYLKKQENNDIFFVYIYNKLDKLCILILVYKDFFKKLRFIIPLKLKFIVPPLYILYIKLLLLQNESETSLGQETYPYHTFTFLKFLIHMIIGKNLTNIFKSQTSNL